MSGQCCPVMKIAWANDEQHLGIVGIFVNGTSCNNDHSWLTVSRSYERRQRDPVNTKTEKKGKKGRTRIH
jgi:hypothetical protein